MNVHEANRRFFRAGFELDSSRGMIVVRDTRSDSKYPVAEFYTLANAEEFILGAGNESARLEDLMAHGVDATGLVAAVRGTEGVVAARMMNVPRDPETPRWVA